jgi:hypothetical protein
LWANFLAMLAYLIGIGKPNKAAAPEIKAEPLIK